MNDYSLDKYGWPEEMGTELRAEITRQLLCDLSHYGITEPDLSLDWSEACIEGDSSGYLDGVIQNYSGVGILDKHNHVIGEGWIEFVHEGGSASLFVYWHYLTLGDEELKTKPGIPLHVWEKLPQSARKLFAKYQM